MSVRSIVDGAGRGWESMTRQRESGEFQVHSGWSRRRVGEYDKVRNHRLRRVSITAKLFYPRFPLRPGDTNILIGFE